MNKDNRTLWIAAGLIIACGFVVLIGFLLFGIRQLNAPASPPTIDLFATLSASSPVPGSELTPIPPTGYPTVDVSTAKLTLPAPTKTVPSSGTEPTGKIAFTCQVNKVQASDQICVINADGSGFKQLTFDYVRHFYPSMSPDGKSVVYSAYREDNVFEIYEVDIESESIKRLTNRLGVLTAPEISPDGSKIIFTRWTPASDRHLIWTMDRNGDNAGNISGVEGWDPTWSPDGKYVLYAANLNGTNQLYTVRVVNNSGRERKQVGNYPSLRGRSDWSPDGSFIVTYSGPPWNREVYIMNADGTAQRQLTPSGGNSQGPSISPDGNWVAFTAYFDHYGDDHGCEIYIIRTNGSDLRRLTDNDYCDYQPRWGP
ncbi:MAG: hypothetical protein Kow002_07880 [Anaerolineales bacterium]